MEGFVNGGFSFEIFESVEPKKCSWSKEISVIIEAITLGTTFVASSLPPRPTSKSSISALILENAKKAAAVVNSKNVISWLLLTLSVIFKISNKNINVLYGGSVNTENIKEILKITNVDGVLVGGASLKAKDFLAIYSAAVKHLDTLS